MHSKNLSHSKNTVPKTPIRFIRHASKPHKWFAFGAIIAASLGQIFMSLNPYVLEKIVDGFAVTVTYTEKIETFSFWAIIYVLLLAASFLFWRLSGFIGMEWLSRVNATAYNNLYGYVSKHSHGYFINRFAGSLSNKISNAADGSERLLERSLWGWYTELISLIVSIALLFSVDTYIAISFLCLFIVMFFVNLILVRKRRPHVVAYAAASSRLRGDGIDYLTNMAASRQYVRENHELDRISNATNNKRMKDVFQWRLSEWSISLNNVVIVFFVGGVLLYTYFLLVDGLATAGETILVLTVLGRMTHIITFLGSSMNGFIRVYGEIQEGLGAILTPHEINDKPKAKDLRVTGGNIKWKNVDFEFGNTKVFENFGLEIKDGERVGLVGHSGAGKTTFVSLLLRQHELQGGSIEIDGQNISDVTQSSLRKNIAVVPQEPLLFHRTIRENIAYGKPSATKNEIEEVAKKAYAHEFITELPEGYDTLVGERGIKLSGGQKQRIAIARAMLKDAPILILDEATSALDSESEVVIQKALHKLMGGKTVVAVAHRLSTLREMDRIIVMEGGKILETGTHQELVSSGGIYARLWDHQAGGFLSE